ncbi:MAG: flavin reductase [Eubacteriales bacterium]|nr:flavin reductase [Eubacteriales bacterium]
MNNTAMYRLSYGLFVLAVREGENDNGCIINTAMQVTVEPNRIAISVNKDNHTHDMMKRTSAFTISILNEEADFSLFKRFGFQSGRDVNKFESYTNCKRSSNGTMIVTAGTNAFISANVISSTDLGTHTLFIADVTDADILNDVPSATYAYYQQNIKPKPKTPDTANEGKIIWRCTVCGYEYVGEELPKDFICPICKHPASDFERIVVGQAAK